MAPFIAAISHIAMGRSPLSLRKRLLRRPLQSIAAWRWLYGRKWPGAELPEVCRKQTIKGSWRSAKGCYVAPDPQAVIGNQPT